MMIVHGLILLLLISIAPTNSLECYECGCDQDNLSACNCGLISDYDDNDYCTIFEERYTDATYVQLSRIPRNSTWVYIQDPYYILTLESIRYNRATGQWSTWTNGILYGCDWDRCNSPDLINKLPSTFQLVINPTWLNTNIYGTGSVTSCHHCPFENCGNNSNPIDFSQCALTTCINSTSCLAYDLWNNLQTGDQCYQSQCAPAYLDEELGESSGGKYRIDVEAILYLSQDRTKFHIWEIDVYCAATNCSRPTIFQEISNQLMAQVGDLSVFPPIRPWATEAPPTTTPPPTNPIQCYSCECFGTTSCPCNTTIVISSDDSYCILVRENIGQYVYIYSDYIGIYDTYQYINEFPYALIEESITYDEKGGRWYTTTNFVIYGCNWNLCNKPELVPLLPDSYQMRLPEAWLNSSVLGSGLPVRNCHECPDEVQCGTTDFLSQETCPIQPCNTTCLVLDVYDDPAFDYLCYQSFCLPPDTEDYEMERHRIEIEGIVYASEPKVVNIWEIDIYCRADDCSRPEIFKELHAQLSVQVGTLAALFNQTYDPAIPQRRCYDCYCYGRPDCPCERTTVRPSASSYCLLMREYFGQDIWSTLGHIDEESTRVHILEFPYLVVEESILYNEQTQLWNTITNFVVYGCDWDYCNHPDLLPYLPNSFQMRLPEAWLNTNVLGTGQTIRDCHECPDAPQCGTEDFLDASRCPIRACNTTCLVFDTFNNPADDLQCYQSFCAPPDNEDWEIDRHRVEIEGILYLRKQPREVQIWEIDLYCRGDDCSRPEIFNELKSQYTVQIGDLSIFDQQLPATNATPPGTQSTTVGSSATQTPGTGSTTTQPPATQSTPSNASIFTSLNLFKLLLLSIILCNFH